LIEFTFKFTFDFSRLVEESEMYPLLLVFLA
jgi:hypothetical protein